MTEDKVIIRPKVDNMNRTKSASGSPTYASDDFVADTLSGWPLDNVRGLATALNIDVSNYDHLNAGHQRMVLGNMFRKRVRDRENIEEGTGVSWFSELASEHAPVIEEDEAA